jgi:hypothetical protein
MGKRTNPYNRYYTRLGSLTSGDRFLWVVKGRAMVTNIFEVEDPVVGTYRMVGKYVDGEAMRVDLHHNRPLRTETTLRHVQRIDVVLHWRGVRFEEPKEPKESL